MDDEPKIETILKMIAEAIKNDDPVVILAKGKGQSIAMMGGGFERITELILSAICTDPRILTPFRIALEMYEKDKGFKGAKNLGDFLDCENCNGKDKCDIENMVGNDELRDKIRRFAELIKNLMPDDDTIHGKGGDA